MRISDWSSDVCSSDLPDAEAHGQRIECDIAPGLVVEGDRNLLFQAVSNLLDNAIKYGGDGGAVSVRAVRTGAATEIVVADRGPGIAPPYREKVMRSEEHTSELQSLMRTSYAAFCLTKKTQRHDEKAT